MILNEDVYLEHFGVKGMRWGQRKSQAEKATARENKAKKFDNKSLGYQKRIGKIDARLSKIKYNSFIKQDLEQKKKNLSKLNERALKDAEAVRQGKWTSGQKKLAVLGVAAGVIGVKILLDKHKEVKLTNIRKEHQEFVDAKKLLDSKMKTRLKTLTDLSNMKGGDPNSRQGALKEIDNLKTFYQARLDRMAERHGVTSDAIKKMKLSTSLV